MTEKKTRATAKNSEAELFMEEKPVKAKQTRRTTSAAKTPESKKTSAGEKPRKTASAEKKATSAGTRRTTSKAGAKAENAKSETENKTSSRKKTQKVESNPVAEAAVRRSERAAVAARTPHARTNTQPARRNPPSRTQTARGAKKTVKPRKKGHISATFLLLIAIGGLLYGVYLQYNRYIAFAEMKEKVNCATFYAGTTVEGIDVSNMSLEEALDYWQENIESAYESRTVTLSNGESYTAKDFGYQSDYQAVLTSAYAAGRSGSLVERYQALSERVEMPANYTVTRKLYDETLIAAYASGLASQIDTAAQDAKIESFDVDSYSFTFTDSSNGQKLDADQLQSDIRACIENGGGKVALKIDTIEADVTQEEISGEYGMIAYAVTNASSSSSNRLSNIRLALQIINGTCLEPGETFSFNETVGKRTTERGFKMATAYSGGEVTEDVGGGICQVSTTLFNAAVKSDMQIVERHNHSLTVSYVDKGKDAAVNWNSQDLKFTNTSDDNVYIICFLTDEKRVVFGLFGKVLPNGETIEIDAETTGSIDYETVYQASLSLMPGTMNVVQKGKKGYTAVAYKVRKDANGNTLSRELLCKSTYKATNEIVEYGP